MILKDEICMITSEFLTKIQIIEMINNQKWWKIDENSKQNITSEIIIQNVYIIKYNEKINILYDENWIKLKI